MSWWSSEGERKNEKDNADYKREYDEAREGGVRAPQDYIVDWIAPPTSSERAGREAGAQDRERYGAVPRPSIFDDIGSSRSEAGSGKSTRQEGVLSPNEAPETSSTFSVGDSGPLSPWPWIVMGGVALLIVLGVVKCVESERAAQVALQQRQEAERQQASREQIARNALINALIPTFDVYETEFESKNRSVTVTKRRACLADNVKPVTINPNGELYSFLIRRRNADGFVYFPHRDGLLTSRLNGHLKAVFFDAAGGDCSAAFARIVNAHVLPSIWFTQDFGPPMRWDSAPQSSAK